MWSEDGGTENEATLLVSNELDKATGQVINFTSSGVRKIDDGLLASPVATRKVIFIQSNGSDRDRGISEANHALEIREGFVFLLNEVSGKGKTLLIGVVGRRLAADTIANGIDMLSGSLKISIDANAGIFKFDANIRKAKVKIGLTTSG